MAVRLPDRTFEDPYDGVVDLAERVLRTPGTPEDSFTDDPLRMMRAARFASQLGFAVAPSVVAAMTAMAEPARDRLRRADPGRAGEAGAARRTPGAGLALLVETGLAALVLPELPGPARSRSTSTTGTRTSTSTR